uniref:Uncharacterized protein n=1 Tax=Rhizophora mucronata TaxID=61149 RepID=A0A2P2PIL4_RHIMU
MPNLLSREGSFSVLFQMLQRQRRVIMFRVLKEWGRRNR